MSPPRVLFTVEQLGRPVPGGIGRYARSLLGGLGALRADERAAEGRQEGDRAPVDLTLLVPRGAEGSVAPGWPVLRSRLPTRLLAPAWRWGLDPVPHSFDVVHGSALVVPPVRRGGEGRVATVVTVHDLAWRRAPDTGSRRGREWHEAALAQALRRADRFVVPSAAVAGDLVAAGAAAEAVTVIAHGADHLPAPEHEAAAALLAGRGVDGSFLLSVGTLEPRKNLPRLLAAYGLARPSLPEPWPLVVVGPTGWGDVRLDGGGAGVVPLGPVADGVLAALYARCRLFAYVPVIEGFGLPPVEAMVAGVPVVASTGVPSTAPEPGRAPVARLVDPADVEAIAGAIFELCTDEPARRELSSAGRAWAGGLTWLSTARSHVELWRELG